MAKRKNIGCGTVLLVGFFVLVIMSVYDPEKNSLKINKTTTGKKLYVKNNIVNIRVRPSTNSPILFQLAKGDELFEISKSEKWVNVNIPYRNNKEGWIHNSLVTLKYPGKAVKEQTLSSFDGFVRDIKILNAKVKPIAGYDFFSDIHNLGGGVVQLAASDEWLKAPYADRESNVNIIYELWKKHTASKYPVAVHIVDWNGVLVMKKGSELPIAKKKPEQTPAEVAQPKESQTTQTESRTSCGSKRTCGQMSSCSEAYFYLNQCGLSRLDRDKDGVPCEKLCR